MHAHTDTNTHSNTEKTPPSLLFLVSMETRGEGTENSRTGMFANESSLHHASTDLAMVLRRTTLTFSKSKGKNRRCWHLFVGSLKVWYICRPCCVCMFARMCVLRVYLSVCVWTTFLDAFKNKNRHKHRHAPIWSPD